jgi:hypothetical protein
VGCINATCISSDGYTSVSTVPYVQLDVQIAALPVRR